MQTSVVELLEESSEPRVEVGEIHVVDEVVKDAEDPEGPACLHRGAVLDVAPLESVVPVHAADPVAISTLATDHLGGGDRRDRREARNAVGDQHTTFDQS